MSYMASITGKITVIVTAQIILIIVSFLAIVHFESQTTLAGNIVNAAGKNRVLTILVYNEIVDEMLEQGRLRDGNKTIIALDDLRDNILFLKEGGTMSGIEIAPMPSRFDGNWNMVWGKFEQYKGEVSELILVGSIPNNGDSDTQPSIDSIRQTRDDLVALSDALTNHLGQDVDALSSNLILLQISLGMVNVAVHIFMIYLIWKIFGRYAEQRIKMEKFAMAGEFATTMAHNMKNPLGTILNSVMLIKSDRNAVDSATARIERAVKRMSQQIDGVMNYVRDVPIMIDTRSMHEMLHRSLYSVTIPDNIRVSLPENDVLIKCDPEKMEMVFANLILNAVQSIGNDKGYITIRLADDNTEQKDASTTIVFENSGSPIPVNNMQIIFEPLFTTKIYGTGLGLANCRNIMSQHGGSITVVNDPVRFILRLPKDADSGE